jgi:hypothetical protein
MIKLVNQGGAVPSIKSAWEYVVDQSCAVATRAALAEYVQRITAVITGVGLDGGDGDNTVSDEDGVGKEGYEGCKEGYEGCKEGYEGCVHRLPTLEDVMMAHQALAAAAKVTLTELVIRSDGVHTQLHIEAKQAELQVSVQSGTSFAQHIRQQRREEGEIRRQRGERIYKYVNVHLACCSHHKHKSPVDCCRLR